ncbi:MAG: hypothetical protein Kow0079_01850 [Vicingaceae bacterium]
MKEKVFCIGFSKTGTTSLEQALNILGYKVCNGHYNNNYSNYLMALYIHKDYEELYKIINYFDVFVDAPWGGSDLYIKLAKDFNNAKFILTTRNEEKWFNSLKKMFCQFSSDEKDCLNDFHKKGRYGFVYFFKHIFKVESLIENKKTIISNYIKYNNDVIDYFRNNHIDLLILDVEEEKKWEKLCSFLNKDIPKNIPYPHSNKAKDKESKSSFLSSIKRKLNG